MKKRITNIHQIKNDSIVGFKRFKKPNSEKGFIAFVGEDKCDHKINNYAAIDLTTFCDVVPNTSYGDAESNNHASVGDTVKYLKEEYNVERFYEFDSLSSLLKWLAK